MNNSYKAGQNSSAFIFIISACFSSIECKAQSYINQVVTPPSSYNGNIDPKVSLNNAGNVAYVATDVTDNLSKVFLSNCSIPVPFSSDPLSQCSAGQPISFFGANRQFLGNDINNLNPPDILSVDRVSGSPPTFFLRAWHSGTPGFGTVLGRSSIDFASVTSFNSLSDDGTAIARIAAGSSFTPGAQYYFSGTHSETLFPSGAIFSPQLAKDNGVHRAVLTNSPLNQVLQYDTSIGATAFLNPRLIAGTSTGFTNIGTSPGISNDGSIISFYATKSAKNGIYISIDAIEDPSVLPGSVIKTITIPVVTEGDLGVVSLSASSAQRIPVLSKRGSLFTSGSKRKLYYQLATVAFSGSITDSNGISKSGIYVRDILLGIYPQGVKMNGVPDIQVEGLSNISNVASAGDIIDGVTLGSNFQLWNSIASLSAPGVGLHDNDEQSPLIAFSADTAIGKFVGIRSRRVCAVPNGSTKDYKQTDPNWGNDLISNTTSNTNIFHGGCQITSIGNLVNAFASSNITPRDANKLFANKPFIKQDSGLCFPSTSSCQLGPYQQIGGNFLPNGNIEIQGAIPAISLLSGKKMNAAFRVDTNKNLGNATHPTPLSDYPIYSNANTNPLSPAEDFFLCNQEPVVTRVPNCKGSPEACTQHFVLTTGKTVELIANHATYSINDPGYMSNPPTDLINKIAGRERRNTVAGIRAVSMGNIKGNKTPQNLFIRVDSPVSVVVSDPDGRMFGYDPVLDIDHLDIINAEITDDGFSDPDGLADVKETKSIWIGSGEDAYGNSSGNGDGVLDGTYNLNVVGTGTGSYTISVQSSDQNGNIKTRYVTGNTNPGQQDTIFVSRSSIQGVPLSVTSAVAPTRIPGDVLLNGKVDIDDINAINKSVGAIADGTDDPMDIDLDGKITALDARKAVVMCSKPRCAR